MDSVQMVTLTNLRVFFKQYNDEHHHGRPLSLGQHALSGLGTGLVVSFAATPVELLKGKLQVQYDGKGKRVYDGPIDCIKKLYGNHGIAGLFQGLKPCLVFRSFFWVLWGSYEVYSKQLTRAGFGSGTTAFLAGGFAATTFWIISFPADLIKNKIMTQPDPGKNAPRSAYRYPTMLSCAKDIMAKEGLKGFYRGFTPCLLRSFPTNAAAIFVFETVSAAGRYALS
ncbi:hypothetical protein HDU97_005479 [Phlyctochytrium planicorne]|nr:hypothetical protein HDU97_005479 [Phlyctochytrium planicorne]